MKNIYLILFIMVSLCPILYTQQLPLKTQYHDHHIMINPAIPFTDYLMPNYTNYNSIGISYRKQWDDIKNGPRTITCRYDKTIDADGITPILGGFLIMDQAGSFNVFGGYFRGGILAGDYRNFLIGIGGSLGVVDYAFKSENLVLNHQGDPVLSVNDHRLYLDGNLGVHMQINLNDKIIYGGISLNQLLNTSLSKIENFEQNKFNRVLHAYVLGGAFIPLTNNKLIEGSIWTKFVQNVPAQSDIAFRLIFEGNSINLIEDLTFWIGGTTSIDFIKDEYFNSFSPNFGIMIPLNCNDNCHRLRLGTSPAVISNNATSNFGNTYELNGTYTW